MKLIANRIAALVLVMLAAAQSAPALAAAATIAGTPAVIAWGTSGTTPTPVNVTVDASASHFVVAWRRYTGVAETPVWTLGGVSPSRFASSSGTDDVITGYAIWDSPTTGTRSLAVTWDTGAPGPGGVATTVFSVTGAGASSGWVIDLLPSGAGETTARTFTLTGLTVGNLVLQYDGRDESDAGGIYPGTPSSWTSVITQNAFTSGYGGSTRLSSITAASTSQACTSQATLKWNTLLCIGIADAAGAAATLSSATPSGTLGTSTTATIGATTNQNTGTFYAVVGTGSQLTGVTASQIKAGQQASGSAAIASDSNTVTTTSPTADITGLTASTAYTYAAIQNNANGDSNIVTGTFTTAAGGGSSVGSGLLDGKTLSPLRIVR